MAEPAKTRMEIWRNPDFLMAAGLIGILLIMLVPIPPFLLDFCFVISITASLIILFLSIYTNNSLEFSTFPSVLLVITMFRLALNVASTRLILLEGHQGIDAAGHIIKTFGSMVVGGSYVVGIIVFTILVIINFVVITKGAGRVAEVAARFTLDGMPGKQMSIDADLNAGLITEDEAKRRRREVEREADFFGSMDGASKFVRGDAVAAILITIINIVGGLIIGVVQRSLSVVDAAQNYTLLTVGDGLVSQVPALVVSLAAGIIVTKASSDQNLGSQLSSQLFTQPKVFAVTATILGLVGLHPSLPKLPFFLIAGLLGYYAYQRRGVHAAKDGIGASPTLKALAEGKELGVGEAGRPGNDKTFDPSDWVQAVDPIELEVGYGLVPVVDERQNGDLLKRLTHLRRQFAQEMGFVVPPIHIRDNLQLRKGEYTILIKGVKVAGGELMIDHYLAIDPGISGEKIEGIETREPAYGLVALWIRDEQKEKAQLLGYTVVDNSTTIATHLTEIIKVHAHELLGRQELQKLVDRVKATHPKVVEELIPDILPLGIVLRVCKNLLKEGVPIRDMLTILETLADQGSRIKDPDYLTEAVREAMAATITNLYTEDGRLNVMILDREIEEEIARSIHRSDEGTQIALNPQKANDILTALNREVDRAVSNNVQPVILTSPAIRIYFRKLVERFIPNLVVLSHSEVTPQAKIESLGVVRL